MPNDARPGCSSPSPCSAVYEGWQPMESAPKDGSNFYAIVRHANHAICEPHEKLAWEAHVVCRWIDHNGGWTWNGMCGTPVMWKPRPQFWDKAHFTHVSEPNVRGEVPRKAGGRRASKEGAE